MRRRVCSRRSAGIVPLVAAALVASACRASSPATAGPAVRSPAIAHLETTASGRHLVALVEAINSRDSAAILRFGLEHYDRRALEQTGGEARLLARWLEIGTSVGPIEVDTVVATSDLEANAWLRGSISRAWLSIRLFADSAEPHRVVRIGLGRGLRPPHADLRAPLLAAEELPRHIEAYLAALVGADLFSGVVLITRNGTPVVARTYGFADRDRRTPLRLDTPFDLASIGKVFTSVAIAQLAERGALRLTDPVGTYVPEHPQALGQRISIRQLLDHSSGLGELGPGLDSAMRLASRVRDMVALLGDTALAFAPGTSVQYSNRGYVVLGAVIERASGRAYADYVREEIFERAGMTRTALLRATELPPDRAHRYTRYPTLRSAWTPGPRVEFAPAMDLAPGPHGGAYSTAVDLARFSAALTAGRLLGGRTASQLLEPEGDGGRSLGFDAGGTGARRYFGHGGGTPGMNSLLRIYPQLGYTVVVLSNYDNGANLVGAYVSDLLR